MLKNEESGQGTRTVIIAPPSEAGLITGFLEAQQRGEAAAFSIIAREQEIGPGLLESLRQSLAELILIHAAAPGFKVENVRLIAEQGSQVARVVVVFVPAVGDWFDAVSEAGAIAYRLPLRAAPFEELSQALPTLLVEARQQHARRALAEVDRVDRAARDLEQPGAGPGFPTPAAGIRHPTQVIVSWSSKGGDGKSLLAAEIAWQLAQIGGHKTLLVDADMSRGYLAHALDKDAFRFSRHRNITTLAQEYLVRGEISASALKAHLYHVPSLGNKGEGNLDLLFGIASPDAATLPAYAAKDGAQSVRFINNLIDRAYGTYEFIVFDIGTAITIPLHYAVLKAAGHILVVATPSRPSVAPTKEGIRQLESHQATSRDQLRLVINRWSPKAKIKRDELPEYFGIPIFATIPLVEADTLMGLINEGRFISHAVWDDAKEYASLRPFVAGVAAMAENFALGIVEALRKRFEPAAKSERRSFFRF